MQIYDVLLDTETLLFCKQKTAFRFTRLAEEMHFVWPVWKKKHLSFCPSGGRNTFGFIAVWRNKHILFYPSDRKNTFRFANLMI